MKSKIWIIILIVICITVVGISCTVFVSKFGTPTNENEVDHEEFKIITDIEGISEEKWNKTNFLLGDYGYTNKDAFNESYNEKVGETFGKLSIPRTNYTIYTEEDDNYYKIEMNKNKWFFTSEINIFNKRVYDTSFHVLSTEFFLKSFGFNIESDDFDRKYSDDIFMKREYNGWKFAYCKNKEFVASFPIEKGDQIFVEIPIDETKENNFDELAKAFSENVSVEKIDKEVKCHIELPDEFANIKINDDFTLDLVSSVNVSRWTGNKIITGAKGDSAYNYTIEEMYDDVTLEEQKLSETKFAGGHFVFKSYKYKDLNLELEYDDDNSPYSGSVKNRFNGILIVIDDRVYKIDILKSDGGFSINNEEEINKALDHLFTNFLKYRKT